MSTLTWHLNRLAGTLSGGGGPSRQNLCPNPAAGTDVTGWGGGSTPTRSTGLTGLPVTTGAHYSVNGFAQTPTAVTPGAAGLTFTASVYLQNNTGISLGSKTVYLAFTRSVGGDDFSQTKTVSLPAGTTRIDFTGVAPANATGLYLLVDSFNAALGSGVELTACLVEEAGALDDYFDGDSPGATWDGTADNSTSTLAGDDGSVPTETAVSAANIWAGTSDLTLVDALNEKAGASVPAYTFTEALNVIAGTSGLTALDAIGRL